MKTKRDLAIEILGNYENYGCELKQQVFDKVLARLTQCKKYAIEEAVGLVKVSTDKKERGGVLHLCFDWLQIIIIY